MMKTESILQKIKEDHNIGLSENDPIFISVAINDIILSNYIDQFQELLENQKRNIDETISNQLAQSSEILDQSFKDHYKTLNDKTDNYVNEVIQLMNDRQAFQRQDIEKSKKVLQWSVYFSIFCTAFLLGMIVKALFIR
jgi:hypothetical protein